MTSIIEISSNYSLWYTATVTGNSMILFKSFKITVWCGYGITALVALGHK